MMKRTYPLEFVAALLVLWIGGSAHAHPNHECNGPPPATDSTHRIASARIPFVRNHGQIADGGVEFYAQTFAGTVFVTNQTELVYALPLTTREGFHATWAFRENFAGRQPTHPVGDHRSSIHLSSYKGNDSGRWIMNLETYDGVDLGELYPGVRVTLRAAGNNIEKLFHVAPGGDVNAIHIAIDGVDGVTVDSDNQLVLATTGGDISFTAPIAYQMGNGGRQPVDVAYVLSDDHHYGFKVGPYDVEKELVIDPLLASTYLGGHNPQPPGNYDDDIIYGMVAVGGDIYVAGATQSPDFPVHLGYDETLDSSWPDGFVTRMSGDLSTVIASTYIGTDGFDRVTDIALDDDGTIIAVGQAGYGFPVTDGAYTWSGTTPTGGGFVARFSSDLSTLEASAVVTPSGYPWKVALGNAGIYFGGTTNSPEFPITDGAYLSTCCPAGAFGIREYDGFAGKLSTDLTTLEAMTYLGGETVSGIAVAPNGTVFITDGWDYAITGYLASFDAGLTTRSAHRTYYPGSNSGSTRTYFNDVVAGDGFVVTAGQTYMNDLPATEGAFDTTCGTDGLCDGVGPLLVPRSDGFIAIYSEDLQDTLALTYLGGSYHEAIRSVVLGIDGDVYVTGETASVDFPVGGLGADTACGVDGMCDPNGPYSPAADGFVARLSADLSHLEYGSYLGGSGEDRPLVIALDDAQLLYSGGSTGSVDFPTTPGAFDGSYSGGTSDAFISWIDAAPAVVDVIFQDGLEVGDLSHWSGP